MRSCSCCHLSWRFRSSSGSQDQRSPRLAWGNTGTDTWCKPQHTRTHTHGHINMQKYTATFMHTFTSTHGPFAHSSTPMCTHIHHKRRREGRRQKYLVYHNSTTPMLAKGLLLRREKTEKERVMSINGGEKKEEEKSSLSHWTTASSSGMLHQQLSVCRVVIKSTVCYTVK